MPRPSQTAPHFGRPQRELWVPGDYNDWTPVQFVVQMPEGISPDFVRVSWIVRGNGGQVRLTDFTVRDFFARTYETYVPSDVYEDYRGSNNPQFAPGFVGGTDRRRYDFPGLNRSGNIFAHYFDTHVTTVMSGQPIEIAIDGEIESEFIQDDDAGRPAHEFGLALKCRRRVDGGADWYRVALTTGDRDRFGSGSLSTSIRRPAYNAYTQIEPLAYWFIPARRSTGNNNLSGIAFSVLDHLGLSFKITIDDAVESGTG